MQTVGARGSNMSITHHHYVEVPNRSVQLRIDVSLPVGYEECERTYPVVYLLDSDWFFPVVSRSAQLLAMDGEMPEVIVVGLGYVDAGLSSSLSDRRVRYLRQHDLTPKRDDGDWWREAAGMPIGTEIETGGAKPFLDALENLVKPLVRQTYRAESNDETLAGFSLGGLCSLYALFTRPWLYRRYISCSPALWWGRDYLFEVESEAWTRHLDVDATLFTSMGALEEPPALAKWRMVTNWTRLRELLANRNYRSLKWRALLLDNENHATAFASSFIKGLISVFREAEG